jgi:hypothetical protein
MANEEAATSLQDKQERLVSIFGLMQQSAPLMMGATQLESENRTPEAEATLSQLQVLLTQQLDETEAHDKLYPETPLGAGPVLNQLLNILHIRADLVETLGKPDEAEALRELSARLTDAHAVPG